MITLENIFLTWESFKKGKRKRRDVQIFEEHLENNLTELHSDLVDGAYIHGKYSEFFVYDPKKRHIHKATVRDRIVHRLLYDVLTKIYESVFIAHSYSARIEKGTHKAVDTVNSMIRSVSNNYNTSCYVLKCDIAKFFDSVDHEILLALLQRRIYDKKVINMLRGILLSAQGIKSYVPDGKGMPLGNLTSQIFSNIYLHELDFFVKQKLKIKNYVRYADDFFVIHSNKSQLRLYLKEISAFLELELLLSLHHKKVDIMHVNSGVDVLGYLLFPFHRGLRGTTKKRMLKKISQLPNNTCLDENNIKKIEATIASYNGILKHADCYKLSQAIINDNKQ